MALCEGKGESDLATAGRTINLTGLTGCSGSFLPFLKKGKKIHPSSREQMRPIESKSFKLGPEG
jgi:hypothetical protein